MHTRRAITLLSAALLLAVALPATASAAMKLHLSWVHCLTKCQGSNTVQPGGYVKIAGRGLTNRMRAVFSVRAGGVRAAHAAGAAAYGRGRLKARVPSNALSGRVYVRFVRGSGRSNSVGPLYIRKAQKRTSAGTPSNTAFDGNGMWIWYVSKSNGGDLQSIIAQAKARGISTLFIKSSDAANYWSQFSPQLVQTLKAGGLKVCAWQFVYGDDPVGEANVGAEAVSNGADCLVIDAEGQYEKKYGPAQNYMTRLRAAVGPDYPIGLASFPYVDYHPTLPYSVFFAPGGAQFNLPQIYWQEIGGGVDAVTDHSYRFNRPFGKPIDPLGQAYGNVSPADMTRFRQLVAADSSAGVSWWDWQEATPPMWDAISAPLGPLAGPPPSQDFAVLARGAKGDLVVWAQQHLKSAGQPVTVDGDYGASTQAAVSSFQSSAGIPPSGQIDTPTWQALLRYQPVMAKWATSAGVRAAGSGHTGYTAPKSARLPAKRYEIGRNPGAG